MKEQSDRAAKQRTPRWIIILCIAIVAVPVFYILYHNTLDNRVKAKLDAIHIAGQERVRWLLRPPPKRFEVGTFPRCSPPYSL